ncbi:MAG: hypothetical protein GXO79_09955 [Chlorobi bacterium]|nr:hypothetical protein [Chlorobiota bacterium]
MKTIIDQSYVNVTYDEDLKLIKVIWLGNSTSDEYRDTYEKVLEFAKTHPTDNFFSDIQKQKIVSPIDRKWFEEEVLPRAIKLNLKRAGITFGGGIFKRYYFNNIMSKTSRFNLPFKAFSTFEDAVEWFKTFK